MTRALSFIQVMECCWVTMGWTCGWGEREQERIGYRILLEKPRGKGPLPRPSCWNDKAKVDLRGGGVL
jgi:hypothetical protein